MRKIVRIFFLFSIFFNICGCSQRAIPLIDNNAEQQQGVKNDKCIEEVKDKYSAIELDSEEDMFSAEIVDNYKGQNIYSSILDIDDIFYSDGELFMHAEGWDEEYLLKITPEQYSKIKLLNSDSFDIHIVFTLENVKPLIPSIDANFVFHLTNSDKLSTDEDVSVSLDSQMFQGSLIDIMEIE